MLDHFSTMQILSMINESFNEKLKAVQYNACLGITDAIRGTSRERLYRKLGLETLKNRR